MDKYNTREVEDAKKNNKNIVNIRVGKVNFSLST
jgi:hypothetical protein